MAMIAYRCSRCKRLYDDGEHVHCSIGIDPRTNHREKGDAELCRKNFELLGKSQIWHERFAWEEG